MADEALNKSLDDLIKEQRLKQKQKQKPKPKPAAKAKAAGVSGDKQGAAAGGAAAAAGKARKPRNRRGKGSAAAKPTLAAAADLNKTAKGAVSKRKNRGGARPMAVDAGAAGRAAQKQTAAAPRVALNRMASHLGTKLFISNLATKVTSEDIRELFSTMGPLVSSSVHYDRSGKSAGTAEAVFHAKGDAVKAKARYNGVQLDGRSMGIELIEQGAAAAPAERTLKSGLKITPKNGGGGGRQAGGKPSRGRGTLRSRVVVGADAMQE